MSDTTVPLIPREVLFGNPDRASAQISPDGAHLAWLAPRDGVLNVWVAPRGRPGTGACHYARHRPRHPFLCLGAHRQTHSLHPGPERRRELAALCRHSRR